mmetsp:Transcript_103939/g.294499  ORF Transcript_103939/g.294499 Transcript_103939/m.294499 type:complete len:476 (+) Transcript_103939:52-1479(+)
MPEKLPKYDLVSFVQTCFNGDLEQLQVMLDRDDPIHGFQGDINEHHAEYTALQCAALNGQLECVEALLKAGADPHMKTRMPQGRNPDEGKTASQLAEEWGWDDIVAMLAAAEKKEPKGDYMLGGPFNNAKIYPSTLSATGRDREEVKRVSQKLSSMWKPYHLQEADRSTTIGLLFPGQGSQYAKMLGGVKDLPAAKDLLGRAKTVLGWDPLDICANASKLDTVDFGHPALFVAGLVALAKLKQDNPQAAGQPGAVAGFGIADLTALVAADVMSFEDGLKIAKVRAEAMATASKTGAAQAVLSVAGLRQDKVKAFCALEDGGSNVAAVACELFPRGCTCAGTKAAMEKLEKAVKANGALQAKLITSSGALHTKLMAPAVQKVADALKEVAPNMKPPKCDVYMNCTGKPVYSGSPPKSIIPLLLKQMTEPVLWDTCVRGMIGAGISEFYEVGPKNQLKSMMKRIDAAMFERTENVEV